MTPMCSTRIPVWILLAAALAAPALDPAIARAGDDKKVEIDKKAAPGVLKEAGLSFEAARVLNGAEKVAALEQVDAQVDAALRGELSKDETAAARALSAMIRFELKDYESATRMWRGASEEF